MAFSARKAVPLHEEWRAESWWRGWNPLCSKIRRGGWAVSTASTSASQVCMAALCLAVCEAHSSSRGFLGRDPAGEGAVPIKSTGRRPGHTAPLRGPRGSFQVRSLTPGFSQVLRASFSAVKGRRGGDVPRASRFLLQRRLLVRGDGQPGPISQQHLPQHAGLH